MEEAGGLETAAQAGIWDPASLGYKVCLVGACAGALMWEADWLETAAGAGTLSHGHLVLYLGHVAALLGPRPWPVQGCCGPVSLCDGSLGLRPARDEFVLAEPST